MSRHLWRVAFPLVVLLAATGLGLAIDASTPARVERAVMAVVKAHPEFQLLGSGSWIARARFDPAFSDFDMRLIVPPGTSEKLARQMWPEAQDALIAALQKEFGSEAGRVIQRTNLYAPKVLMQGVEEPAEAAARFLELQRVPNLGAPNDLTEAVVKKSAEGLFGEGAKAAVQTKEAAEGALYYCSKNSAYKGTVNVIHCYEGYAKFTVSGTANVTLQWIEHAANAAQSRSPRDVAKYLDRIVKDLGTTRQLAKLSGSQKLINELTNMAAHLRKNPRSLQGLEGTLSSMLNRAGVEASLLRSYGRAGPSGRAIIQSVLENRPGSEGLMETLLKGARKVPVLRLVQFALAYWITSATARQVGEGDVQSVYTGALAVIAGLGPMLAAELASAILETGRACGYDFAARRQDAFDLIEGIYTGVGRAGVDARAYSLDDLVRVIKSEAGLRAFVWARAQDAAARGFGDATGRHDLATAEAIYHKCLPTIMMAWLVKREMLTAEYADLREALQADTMVLTYAPLPANPTDGKVDVTVTPTTLSNKQGETQARLRQILTTLLGSSAGVYVNVHNYWTPAGRDVNGGDIAQVYTFTEPGTYSVKLRQVISMGAATEPLRSPWVKEISREFAIEIPVGTGGGTTPPPQRMTSSLPLDFSLVLAHTQPKPVTARVTGTVTASIPLTGGQSLSANQDLTSRHGTQSTRDFDPIRLHPPVKQQATASVSVTARNTEYLAESGIKWVFTFDKASLMAASSGTAYRVEGNTVTYTPPEWGGGTIIWLRLRWDVETISPTGHREKDERVFLIPLIELMGK